MDILDNSGAGPEKKWTSRKLDLHPGHTWTARPGCQVFVAGRGAVRFDIPRGWAIVPDADSLKIYNKQPPADDCRLAVSYIQPPKEWSAIPIATVVEAATAGPGDGPVRRWGPIATERRDDLEIGWREAAFDDPVGKREARSRLAIGRRLHIQCLITFDYWPSDAAWCLPHWDTALATLDLARYIDDPTRGPAAT